MRELTDYEIKSLNNYKAFLKYFCGIALFYESTQEYILFNGVATAKILYICKSLRELDAFCAGAISIIAEKTIPKVYTEHKIANRDKIHIVVGYIESDNGSYSSVMGAFSTTSLAKECGDELKAADVISYYEIESPLIDEFGYK